MKIGKDSPTDGNSLHEVETSMTPVDLEIQDEYKHV